MNMLFHCPMKQHTIFVNKTALNENFNKTLLLSSAKMYDQQGKC